MRIFVPSRASQWNVESLLLSARLPGTGFLATCEVLLCLPVSIVCGQLKNTLFNHDSCDIGSGAHLVGFLKEMLYSV